jgi:hypothetical protein
VLPTFTREGSQVRSLSRPPFEILTQNPKSSAVWETKPAADCVVYLA